MRGRKKRKKTDFKRANGTGCIRKLSGKRRKPYQVMITTGYSFDVETNKAKQIVKQLGTYITREEAEEALREYNASPFDFEKANITFGEIYKLWSNKKYKNLSKSTIESYTSAFKHCKDIKDVAIKKLNTAFLQEVVDKCQHGSNTKTNIKTVMIAIFNYAEKNDIVAKNYAEFIEIEQSDPVYQRTVFSLEDIHRLKEKDNDCYVQIVLILLYSGMRVNELLLMKREDCDLEKNIFNIRKSKTKSGVRQVPIHKNIKKYVVEFYNRNGENLITNKTGHKVPYNNFVSRQFKKMMKDLNVVHRLHDTLLYLEQKN